MKKYYFVIALVLLFAVSATFAAEDVIDDYTDTYTFAHTLLLPLDTLEKEFAASLDDYKNAGFSVEFDGDSVQGNLYILEKYYDTEQINLFAVYFFRPDGDKMIRSVEVSFEAASKESFDISLFLKEAYAMYGFDGSGKMDWEITDDPDTWVFVDGYREDMSYKLTYLPRIIKGQTIQVDSENSTLLLENRLILESFSYTTDKKAMLFACTVF